jgi:hypothetical protein
VRAAETVSLIGELHLQAAIKVVERRASQKETRLPLGCAQEMREKEKLTNWNYSQGRTDPINK